MRHLILTLLLLPATLMAAEPLNNAKLGNAYITGEGDCLPGKNKKLPRGCKPGSGSRAVTEKALRDAEKLNTSPALGNPDIPPPPTELPSPPIKPLLLQHRQESLTVP
ncbi:MAG: hypothetical protein PSX71_00965 [bacterium]|nr:hypothetical protein [bacterium]